MIDYNNPQVVSTILQLINNMKVNFQNKRFEEFEESLQLLCIVINEPESSVPVQEEDLDDDKILYFPGIKPFGDHE